MIHINPKMAKLANPALKKFPDKMECDNCILGKFHKHPHSGSRPSQMDFPWAPGEYLTGDLFGPVLKSEGGASYADINIDVKSRYVYVNLLANKKDHFDAIEGVRSDLKARSGKTLRFFKTDGDGIYTGGRALDFYAKYDIRHIQSAPGDSASNDMAERVIRTLIELTRTNLLHSGAPPNMWGECLLMVAHVWNNLATCVGKDGQTISRRSILEGHTRKFDLSTLRAFGTKCFFMLTVQKKGGKKLALGPKAKAGVIIGIEDNMPAYRVLEMNPRGKAHRIPFAQTVFFLHRTRNLLTNDNKASQAGGW